MQGGVHGGDYAGRNLGVHAGAFGRTNMPLIWAARRLIFIGVKRPSAPSERRLRGFVWPLQAENSSSDSNAPAGRERKGG